MSLEAETVYMDSTPANDRQVQSVPTKRVMEELKNSWINIKRAELPRQMESLVPFLSDSLRV